MHISKLLYNLLQTSVKEARDLMCAHAGTCACIVLIIQPMPMAQQGKAGFHLYVVLTTRADS